MVERAQVNSYSDPASRWIASAPGRINLIGEHTDYNLGFTLPMAIHRYTNIAAQLANDNFLTFESNQFPGTAVYSLDGSECISHDPVTNWSRYLAGVVKEMTKAGFHLPPLKFQVESDVPPGAGVSSSASVEVAMAMLIQKITHRRLTGLDTALLCQLAEHQHVGVPCGLMDQLASIFGMANHLMLLDCRSNTIQQIPISSELAVVVVNSQVRHNLAAGEYRRRREQCEAACPILAVDSLREVSMDDLQRHQQQMPELVFRRAQHVVTENRRTVEAAERMLSLQWQVVGELMYLSHGSMRDDFEISTPEIDLLVKIARSLGKEQGVWGSRMTGGGFGGCTITLTLADRAETILQKIIETYRKMTGNSVDGFVTHPADGAWALEGNAVRNGI